MKHTLSKTLLAACLCAGPIAVPAAAGELQRQHVPAEARWVGHFDMQAFQRTGLWREIVARSGPDGDVGISFDELEELRTELGIDPLKDLRSVTIYGRSEDEDDVVVLLETTAAIDNALTRFSQEDGYRLTEHAGLEIHAWSNDGYVHVMPGPDNGRLVTIAPRLANVVEGVRVIHSQSPSLAAETSPRLSAMPLSGSFLFFASIDGIPGIHEIDASSQVAALATGLVFDLGESGSELFVRANVQTGDVESALNLGDVVDGLLALGKLALGSQDAPPEIVGLLRALQVETRGSAVWIEFRYDVVGLFRLVEELSQEGW